MPAEVGSNVKLQGESTIPVGQTLAVIDIGTASVRLAIAEVCSAKTLSILETLEQDVRIGIDTFTRGAVRRRTTEDCVTVLNRYKRILQEYGVSFPARMRAVATSAVREASNRDSFVDRVFIGTGIEVEVIDEAEVNRYTYLGVEPFLPSCDKDRDKSTIVLEIGAGSTELLLVHNRDVVLSRSYRLGSLRLREMMEQLQGSGVKLGDLLATEIQRGIEQFQQNIMSGGPSGLIALGGEARFAASRLKPGWENKGSARIPLRELEKLEQRLSSMSEADISRQYHLTATSAQTLAPALLALVYHARSFKVKSITVTNASMRRGVLMEMVLPESWSPEFRRQILQSALELGRKYNFNEGHGTGVARLCSSLFFELEDEHLLSSRYELILHITALLHEIGLFIGTPSHHKHSYYLISNSELFGLGRKDLNLVALVARYHRRAVPRPNHPGYSELDDASRLVVKKLSAILRLADALERSHQQRIEVLECRREGLSLVGTVSGAQDLAVEQMALKEKGSLFQDIYGLQVVLEKGHPRRKLKS